jgi:hypothetical protein
VACTPSERRRESALAGAQRSWAIIALAVAGVATYWLVRWRSTPQVNMKPGTLTVFTKYQTSVGRLFCREVARQCRHALVAADDLERALNQGDKGRAWYALHALMASSANISKLLWPATDTQRGNRAGHKYSPIANLGEKLRNRLAVKDDSPLQSRELRNHFEHFSERLEEWAVDPATKVFTDDMIGPPNMLTGVAPRDRLRWYNPQDRTAYFRDEAYPLESLIGAIWDLWPRAAAAAKPSKWQKETPPPKPGWIP